MVPLLLIFGNKMFGISSSLRHICAACIPTKNPFFKYDWKKETWNLIFALGIVIGGHIAWTHLTLHDAGVEFIGPEIERTVFANPIYDSMSDVTKLMFHNWGLSKHYEVSPEQIFSWENALNPFGIFFMLIGGFFVGFGTRYANGCTSGHSIMGISQLSVASMIATVGFFIGGLISSWFIVPYLFELF
jgi:uncharacterized membrane protein YedE/YeeE